MKRSKRLPVKKRTLPRQRLLLLWRRSRSATIAIISAIPLTLLLSSVGVFRHVETTVSDAMMHLQSTAQDSKVAVIRITNEDYRTIFKGKTPLDPSALQAIINAIAKGNPKVIGVAIDTAPPQFQIIEPAPSGPPVIWAREGDYSNLDNKFYLDDVLGGKTLPVKSGLVMLKLDKDEIVRRYRRLYVTDTGLVPSFPWALIKEAQFASTRHLQESQDELLIRFAGDPKQPHRFVLPASEIIRLSGEKNWPSNEIIRDKIVLLGGTYAGQDEHESPLGLMAGVEVLAQIVETELQGGGVKAPTTVSIILLGISAGFIFWGILSLLSLRKALLVSLPVIIVLSFVCSLVASGSVSQFAYFVLTLAAVLTQQLYERFKELQKKEISH